MIDKNRYNMIVDAIEYLDGQWPKGSVSEDRVLVKQENRDGSFCYSSCNSNWPDHLFAFDESLYIEICTHQEFNEVLDNEKR